MELHSRNFRIVVWIWKALKKLVLKRVKMNRNLNRTVIDTSSFYLMLSSYWYC